MSNTGPLVLRFYYPRNLQELRLDVLKSRKKRLYLISDTTKPTKRLVCLRPVWSVFAKPSVGSQGPMAASCGQGRLIRLGRCPGWSESFFAGCVSHFVGFVMLWLNLYSQSHAYTFIYLVFQHLSRLMTKPTKWVWAHRRLRSAWASTQSDQSLRCPNEETLGP